MNLFYTLFFIGISISLSAQTTCGTGQLKITLSDSGNGISVTDLLNGATEILNDTSELFSLDIRNSNNETHTISSSAHWDSRNIALSPDNKDCTITLSNPNFTGIPTSLVATVTIHTNGSQSEWDLSVTGVGDSHSFMDASFPHLNILGNGGQFLTPQYSGQLIANPAAGINYNGFYPRGNGANMQFMAYYGAGSNVYFGFHDPTAAFKRFLAHNENGGVNVECQLPIPNKTLTGNDWDFPGHFELDLFSGDWYGAAMIYKDWASNHANYWPAMTAARETRQAEIGKIGAWFYDEGYYNGNARTPASIQASTQNCIDYIPNVPIATHLYTWWGGPMDDNFPELFPAIDGLANSIATLQANGATIMPYFNGYIYDTDLASFNGSGLPNATKRENGDYFSQDFGGQHFAVMCPTTSTWQDIIKNATVNIANTMGANGVYLDQVSAAVGRECMDTTHNHTLGGGSFWREGYHDLISNVHTSIPANRFVTTEGACDYLLDEVDGCLVDPWDKANMVPAYPSVYSGKVQLFGTQTGVSTYNKASFYAQLAQTFSFGIQPGRFTTYIMNDPNAEATARPFVRQLARMRYRLHPFMSFGEMKYPPAVNPTNPAVIPEITSNWGSGDVTISSLQTSLWQKGDSIAFVFVNASMTEDELNFNFNVNGSNFGIAGNLFVREITENSDGTNTTVNNSFTQNVTLGAMEIKAYIIKAAAPLPVEMISFSGYKRDQAVALKWETSSETNFKGFGIERSQDGVHWESIGYVASKGNSLAQNNYQHLDNTPNQGINYYRLKEMDLDGQFKYSNTISVYFEHGTIHVYPNPTHGTIFIQSNNFSIDKILIYNQLGQLVFTSNDTGNTLDISLLPKGLYTVMVQSKSELLKQLVILE